jgi:sialidase-1
MPLLEETEVFVGGHDDINTYRIPGMVCTGGGTVLAFCEARINTNADRSPTHVALKRSLGNAAEWVARPKPGLTPEARSRQRNMMWQPMQIVLRSTGREAYMNPVPIVVRATGAVHLLVNHHRVDDKHELGVPMLLLTSRDEGATWSEPVDITPAVGLKELGPGIGIQMRCGRLVAPTYDGVIFSDDEGQTWQAGGATTGPISEAQVVELADGSLMLNARGAPNRTVVISKDGGQSWGEPRRDSTLTDSELYGGCQASIVRYTRQDQGAARNRLLFANPAHTKYRFDMTVRLSYDEGQTWPVVRLVKRGTAAYSSMTVLPDGSVGLIYETGNVYADAAGDGVVVEYYAKLALARFNLEWLTGGEDRR